MNQLKDMIPENALHGRRIQVRTYELDGDRLIAEGWLLDEQFIPTFEIDKSLKEPGIVHHIGIRLLLSGWPLKIEDAEAEMPDVPHELCPTTLDSIRKVIGVSIASGFTEEVHKRIGGVKGCAHLTYLLTSMATAAVHGYWCKKTKEPRPGTGDLKDYPEIHSLVNTCKLWEKDGPIMQMIRENFTP